jgi:hypothetical protein
LLRYDVRCLSGGLRPEGHHEHETKMFASKFVSSAVSASAISVLPGAGKLWVDSPALLARTKRRRTNPGQ